MLAFIDYVLSLPDAVDKQVNEELHSVIEEDTLEFMSTIERRALEQGLEQGRELGNIEAVRNVILSQLQLKFGNLPSWVPERVNVASFQQVQEWLMAILKVDTLDDLFA